MSAATPSTEVPGTPRRKHRHDLGHEDHGPKVAEATTRGIQTILGLWIALTLGLVVYVLVDGSRPRAMTPRPAPTSTPSAPASATH
jgi:hypothetical protein